jgi:flagellar biosynthesis/type III secretory pathway protein FliH
METLRSSATGLDQLIRVDGGQLAAGLQDYAERTATDLQAAIDRIDGVNQGQADDWTARVNESTNALVREIDAKLDNFDGHVDQKLHEVFEQAARLIVRLQNGLDMKAGILNEMLGRRASELSKIIGTMIDGYVNTEGPSK